MGFRVKSNRAQIVPCSLPVIRWPPPCGGLLCRLGACGPATFAGVSSGRCPPSAPIPGASPNRRGRPRAGRPARRGLHRRLRAARKNAGNPPPLVMSAFFPGPWPGGAPVAEGRGRLYAGRGRLRAGAAPAGRCNPRLLSFVVLAAVPGCRPSPARRLAWAGPGLRRPLPALQRLAAPPQRASTLPPVPGPAWRSYSVVQGTGCRPSAQVGSPAVLPRRGSVGHRILWPRRGRGRGDGGTGCEECTHAPSGRLSGAFVGAGQGNPRLQGHKRP